MQESRFVQRKLPVVLIAAVVQGWALYTLHQSIQRELWPATHAGWLMALYALVIVVPLATQLLAEYDASKTRTIIIALIGSAYFYFGWHFGNEVHQGAAKALFDSDHFFPSALAMVLLGLLMLPFVQARLANGRWIAPYTFWFTTAWRNKLMLAEAALFTGLFWLLLLLWQELFRMLGIKFFRELFQEPLFVYPITTLVFGIALHLIGSVERLTSAILEQLLNVLKWLAIVVAILLTVFTVALIFKLPGLVFEGQKAIGAAWLLWLVAVTVLLINAAYRDGTVPRPYPQWIALGLRCAIPLTIVIALTALVALFIRARHYGVTVERVWAFIVAFTALAYAIGYSFAALGDKAALGKKELGKNEWMQGVGRVNVIVAVALIVVVALTLTPILSPYRLAAQSQYKQALVSTADAAANDSSAFRYLKFDAGRYGVAKLNALAGLDEHPASARIRASAAVALKLENRWESPPVNANDVLNNLVLFPGDRELAPELRSVLIEEIGKISKDQILPGNPTQSTAGVFADLGGDSAEEFVLLYPIGGRIYQRNGNAWELKGGVVRSNSMKWKSLLDEIRNGRVRALASEWKQLSIGPYRFRVGDIDEHSPAAAMDVD